MCPPETPAQAVPPSPLADKRAGRGSCAPTLVSPGPLGEVQLTLAPALACVLLSVWPLVPEASASCPDVAHVSLQSRQCRRRRQSSSPAGSPIPHHPPSQCRQRLKIPSGPHVTTQPSPAGPPFPPSQLVSPVLQTEISATGSRGRLRGRVQRALDWGADEGEGRTAYSGTAQPAWRSQCRALWREAPDPDQAPQGGVGAQQALFPRVLAGVPGACWVTP